MKMVEVTEDILEKLLAKIIKLEVENSKLRGVVCEFGTYLSERGQILSQHALKTISSVSAEERAVR